MIRTLCAADFSAFRALRTRAIVEHPVAFVQTLEELASLTDEHLKNLLLPTETRFVLGAFENEKLIGTLGIRRDPGLKLRHRAEVWGVFVDSEFRGFGHGKKMLELAIAKLRESPEIVQMFLRVAPTQPTAIKLYESFGFEVSGREPKAIKIDEVFYDLEIMVLDI